MLSRRVTLDILLHYTELFLSDNWELCIWLVKGVKLRTQFDTLRNSLSFLYTIYRKRVYLTDTLYYSSFQKIKLSFIRTYGHKGKSYWYYFL